MQLLLKRREPMFGIVSKRSQLDMKQKVSTVVVGPWLYSSFATPA